MAGHHQRALRRCTAVAVACFACAAPGASAQAAVPANEEALVVARQPAKADSRVGARLRSAASEAGLDLVRKLPKLGAVSVDLPAGETIAELRARLTADPAVVAVEPNLTLEPRRRPSDPAYSAADPDAPGGDTYQWHLRQSGFKRAWKRSTGEGTEVAVIDTGADASHPDLRPRIKAAVDNDDTLLHGGPEVDENGHGSHVAGLACGNSDDDFGIASAGYACDLAVYKTGLTISSISESIAEATDRGVDVINMSFGGDGSSQTLRRAVERAIAADIVLVAAADNDDVDADGNPTQDQGIPARYLQPVRSKPRIKRGKGLVVTAAEHGGDRAWFGPGRGTGISLAAYGSAGADHRGIFSTFPGDLTEIESVEFCSGCRASFRGDDRFAYLEGTSMATPQVAGAAALIRAAKPGIRAIRVVRILKRKAKRDDGFSAELGWGVLNANKAVRAATKKKKKRR